MLTTEGKETMKIYSHEELVQAKELAQSTSLHLRKENKELKRVVQHLQEKARQDAKIIDQLVAQRNDLAVSLKNHHICIY